MTSIGGIVLDTFRELVWPTVLKAAMGKLFAALPFLGWGPIGWVVTAIFDQFAGYLYLALKEMVDLEEIYLKNDESKKKFVSSSLQLKLIARRHGIDSPEFRKARDENLDDLAEFVAVRRPNELLP